MKKFLKVFFIIIAIILVILLIHTIRNYLIVKQLQENFKQYESVDNYYLKMVSTQNNNTVVTTDYYKKDKKQAVFMNRNVDNKITKISMYDDGSKILSFYENEEGKTYQENMPSMISVTFINCFESGSDFSTFLLCIRAKIKEVECNGKICYKVTNFMSPNFLAGIENVSFVEKDTGLLIKNIEGETVSVDREYEFNNVSDEIFKAPDISQYTLVDESGELQSTINNDTGRNEDMKLYIKVNDKILTATLEENTSTDALIEKLEQSDITIDMEDYANFEKVGPLGFSLPRNDKQITTEAGDIILYQGNSITIYYDTNSWNFTKLGHIDNITQEDLKEILGSGDVTVTLTLKQ